MTVPGQFITAYDDVGCYTAVADVVAHLGLRDQPEQVRQRAFDDARAAAGHPKLASARGLSARLGRSWPDVVAIAVGADGAVTPQGATRADTRAVDDDELDERHVVFALGWVARQIGRRTFTPGEYDTAREQAVADRRRGATLAELLPTANQLRRLAHGSWDLALAMAALQPRDGILTADGQRFADEFRRRHGLDAPPPPDHGPGRRTRRNADPDRQLVTGQPEPAAAADDDAHDHRLLQHAHDAPDATRVDDDAGATVADDEGAPGDAPQDPDRQTLAPLTPTGPVARSARGQTPRPPSDALSRGDAVYWFVRLQGGWPSGVRALNDWAGRADVAIAFTNTRQALDDGIAAAKRRLMAENRDVPGEHLTVSTARLAETDVPGDLPARKRMRKDVTEQECVDAVLAYLASLPRSQRGTRAGYVRWKPAEHGHPGLSHFDQHGGWAAVHAKALARRPSS